MRGYNWPLCFVFTIRYILIHQVKFWYQTSGFFDASEQQTDQIKKAGFGDNSGNC